MEVGVRDRGWWVLGIGGGWGYEFIMDTMQPWHIGSKVFVSENDHFRAITDSGAARRAACPKPAGRQAWDRLPDGRDLSTGPSPMYPSILGEGYVNLPKVRS